MTDPYEGFKTKIVGVDEPVSMSAPATGEAPAVSMLTKRAQGVFLGQCVGDALGGTLEFSQKSRNYERYPEGLRDVIGKGPFSLLPGQITDDTELALALARTLCEHGLDFDEIAKSYVAWKASGPFDCGGTCGNAFSGYGIKGNGATAALLQKRSRHTSSQANGSLMRISPLAIFMHSMDTADRILAAMSEATLSHNHPVCQVANAVFCEAIYVGLHGGTKEEMFDAARSIAKSAEYLDSAGSVAGVLNKVFSGVEYKLDASQIGWVLHALHAAFYELLWGNDYEDSLVKIVMAGGDTDTNGAIAGALLGAAYGIDGIPERWVKTIIGCDDTGRGEFYQCNDAFDLVQGLIEAGIEHVFEDEYSETAVTR